LSISSSHKVGNEITSSLFPTQILKNIPIANFINIVFNASNYGASSLCTRFTMTLLAFWIPTFSTFVTSLTKLEFDLVTCF
jgi:hypothetical protein